MKLLPYSLARRLCRPSGSTTTCIDLRMSRSNSGRLAWNRESRRPHWRRCRPPMQRFYRRGRWRDRNLGHAKFMFASWAPHETTQEPGLAYHVRFAMGAFDFYLLVACCHFPVPRDDALESFRTSQFSSTATPRARKRPIAMTPIQDIVTTIDTCLADIEIWKGMLEAAPGRQHRTVDAERCLKFGVRIFDSFLATYDPVNTDETHIHGYCLQEWHDIALSVIREFGRANDERIVEAIADRVTRVSQCGSLSILDSSASLRSHF